MPVIRKKYWTMLAEQNRGYSQKGDQDKGLSLFIVGRLLSFVGLAIELSIDGSHAAEEAGYQLSASGS